jgi:hypothetical protein
LSGGSRMGRICPTGGNRMNIISRTGTAADTSRGGAGGAKSARANVVSLSSNRVWPSTSL